MDKSAVIIGGGLGGLFAGAILAKEGVKVTVIEKNINVGGGLRSFTRFGEVFDTGMHVIGGMRPDGNIFRICKYLGITLLPQAGVALGMCITARQLGAEGDLIRNIILFSVLIYELVGPILTKQALTHAGDIQPVPEHIKNRRQIKLQEAAQRGK
jgi:hypothetical protein